MAFYLRLEHPEDLEFLQGVIDKLIQRCKEQHLSDLTVIDKIYRLQDALLQVRSTEKAHQLEIPQEQIDSDNAQKKRSQSSSKDDWIPNHCKDHPKRYLKRAPSDDCADCWKAFKKLHPLEYDQARRKYDRKKSQVAANS